jgi:hypothetical protein
MKSSASRERLFGFVPTGTRLLVYAARSGGTRRMNWRRYNSRVAVTSNPARTFRLTLDLFDAGVQLMRQNLRRRDPGADDQAIERQLVRWLRDRPGAEHGDCQGRPLDIVTRIG